MHLMSFCKKCFKSLKSTHIRTFELFIDEPVMQYLKQSSHTNETDKLHIYKLVYNN